MTATTDQLVITEPGVYDIPEDAYHRDPVPGGSLSSSGARKLLPPSCPALFRYEQDHPVHRDVFDFGTAAHRMVLGTGPEIAIVDAPDWRTKAAKEAQAEAREAGRCPLLIDDWARVAEMAQALRTHPLASALLCRADVEPERSLFWHDDEFGIWRRARLDAHRSAGGRLLITDYKTTACAEPDTFARSAARYGYHAQGAYYTDAAMALLDDDPAFLLVAQEKTPPYLVTVIELDQPAIATGRSMNRRAMEVYRDCTEAGRWPGYTADDEIALVSLPAWARDREDW